MKLAVTWIAAASAFLSAITWFWVAKAAAFQPSGRQPDLPEAKQMWLLHGLIAGARESARRLRWAALLSGLAVLFTGLAVLL